MAFEQPEQTLDRWSRHRFTTGLHDTSERLFLTDRVPFYYVERADNRIHIVRDGDSLRSLAARFFSSLSYASDLWYVIADFQHDGFGRPAPIHDPTLARAAGRELVIPSVTTVLTEILSEERRLLHDV